MNPIISRELISHLRSPKLFLQLFFMLILGAFVACVGYSQVRANLIYHNINMINIDYDGRFIFFFLTYMACFLAVPVATMAASCIVRERESDSLDLLLTTPLTPISILFGKLLAILLSMLLTLVAFTPIISLCFMIGGLAPDEVMQSLLALIGLYFIVSIIGLAISLFARSSGTAARLSIFALIILLFGPFSLRLLYEVSKIGVVYVENVRFFVEFLFNPILAIFLVQHPKSYFKEFIAGPGYLSGSTTILTALLGFFILSYIFSKKGALLTQRVSYNEIMPDLIRWFSFLNPLQKTNVEEDVFKYGSHAILKKEVMTKNRRVLSHDLTVVVSCCMVMFFSAGLLFSVARSGRDVSHSITYMILGVFGMTLSGLYAPILPSFTIWQERLIDAWDVLRTTTLQSKDIIRGKIHAAFRQSAIPMISIFISFYLSISYFFVVYNRNPERLFILEISCLMFFFLVCAFFYSCAGIYFSSSPKVNRSAPFRKTYLVVFMHTLIPIVVGAFLIGFSSLIIIPAGGDQYLLRDVQNFIMYYIFTFSPGWLIWQPDWGYAIFVVVIVHSAMMIGCGLMLLKWAERRIEMMN